MEIRGNKFVVTGGCGFIGSHIVERLLGEGASQVVILDTLVRGRMENLGAAANDERVHLHQADIRFAHEIEPYFEGAAGCFHLATLRITQCAAEPRRALEVMVDGTYNVVESCLRHQVARLIFSSSASVYGMADAFPTDERHHGWNNNTWYGATKMLGEGLLRSFKDMYGLDYLALRYFNVYGPRMDLFGKYTEVLVRWLDCFDRGERPVIFGDGLQTMDLVYVDDVAAANLVAMQSDLTDKVFNVGTGREVSLLDLLHALARAYGLDGIEPEFQPARSVNPVPRRLASTVGAAERLGFVATTGLEAGLAKLIDWRRQSTKKPV